MKNWIINLVLLLIYIPIITSLALAETNQSLVITGALLIDGNGAEPIQDGVVVISDGRIAKVGSKTNVTIPKGSKVIDLEGGTILPGFINAHVHCAYDESLLQAWAKEGVTTVRDLAANPPETSYAKRDLLNKNPLNARLVAAGQPMSGGFRSRYVPVLIITTVEEARFEANRMLDEGADLLKLMIDSNFNSELMPEPVARTIIEIAHKRGTRVATHIGLSRDIQTAINIGVEELAHMVIDPLPDDLITKMVNAGIYVTPTIEIQKGWGFDTHILDNLGRFVKAGGKVVLGTDFAVGTFFEFELGMPLKEILWMQEAGMTPMQIIVAGTKNAAVVCNLGSELGTLEPGKIADILVIDGNPLKDLTNLKKVRLVIKKGGVIRQ
jgi:imidazolonepropionase-like amidohydrolase